MINVFAIIRFFDIILDDLNIYPIRIFTLIKLGQIKEEQGLPTVTITLHVADNFWPQKSFPLNSALFAHRELLYFKNTYRVIICNCHFLYLFDGHQKTTKSYNSIIFVNLIYRHFDILRSHYGQVKKVMPFQAV